MGLIPPTNGAFRAPTITGDGAHLAQQCNQNNAMFHGSCRDMLLQCQWSVVAKRLNVTTARQNQFPNRCFYLGSTDLNKTRHLTTKKHTSPWRIRQKMRLPDRKEPTEPGIESKGHTCQGQHRPTSRKYGDQQGLVRNTVVQEQYIYSKPKKHNVPTNFHDFCVAALFAGAEKRS